MLSLAFPVFDFKIKQEGDSRYIYDFIRKRYVLLSPEEWVRQNLLVYLCQVMAYPKGLISVEKEFRLNGTRKRYDIVVYNHEHRPWMLVECKAPGVSVSDQVLQQLLRYHNVLQCPYWLLTNGRQSFCAGVNGAEVTWLSALPAHNS